MEGIAKRGVTIGSVSFVLPTGSHERPVRDNRLSLVTLPAAGMHARVRDGPSLALPTPHRRVRFAIRAKRTGIDRIRVQGNRGSRRNTLQVSRRHQVV